MGLRAAFLFAPLGVYRNGSGRRADMGIEAVGTDDGDDDDPGSDEELNDAEGMRAAAPDVGTCCHARRWGGRSAVRISNGGTWEGRTTIASTLNGR